MNTTDKDIINKIAYNENSSTKECCLTPLKMWESQAIRASQKVAALQKEIKKLLDVIAKSHTTMLRLCQSVIIFPLIWDFALP